MPDRFPFGPYPSGWFRVAYSAQLLAGQLMPLRYFGRDLVLFRTVDGRPHLLDAHCAHLGAHLGHGGCVRGDRLECPFHAWQYDGSGQCVRVQGDAKIPPKAQVRSHPVCEQNGMVFAYHALDDREPDWSIPPVPELHDPAWTTPVVRRFQVRSHVQEMAENAADSGHQAVVHRLDGARIRECVFDGPRFRITSDWQVTGERAYGQDLPGVTEISYHGMGFAVSYVRLPISENLLVSTMTPVEDELIDYQFFVTTKRVPSAEATEFLADTFLRGFVEDVTRDIEIWSNKRYVERPLLTSYDGPIIDLRRWARQFYGGAAGCASQ